jgi:hypothetical protein
MSSMRVKPFAFFMVPPEGGGAAPRSLSCPGSIDPFPPGDDAEA